MGKVEFRGVFNIDADPKTVENVRGYIRDSISLALDKLQKDIPLSDEAKEKCMDVSKMKSKRDYVGPSYVTGYPSSDWIVDVSIGK